MVANNRCLKGFSFEMIRLSYCLSTYETNVACTVFDAELNSYGVQWGGGEGCIIQM